MNLEELGWSPFFAEALRQHEGLTPARVAAQHRGEYELLNEEGELRARVAGQFLGGHDFPAVGDWVGVGDGVIRAILPRRTKFSRKVALDAAEEQVVAANVDTVLLVSSFGRDLNLRRLERYLTMAWESGARPVIVLTKVDLEPDAAAQVGEVEAIAFGVPVHPASGVTGEGLDALEQYLVPGETVALLGSSGVGKSTLVNRLAGREVLATQEVRDDGRGRHTTVHRELVPLPGGRGLVLDTPGMRELQLWEASDGLEEAFADISVLAARCRFSDCSHEREPGCAVQAALADGSLARDRFESYRSLERELRALEVRQDARLRAEERRKIRVVERSRRKLKYRR